MINAKELAKLLLEAVDDKLAEPAFFRALLDASVYVHVPRNAKSDRLSIVQFTTPEGLTVLPFFSDSQQAKAASGPSVAVMKLTGRQLFSLTRGATLMLNPNETSCILYPEELSMLLDEGEVAVIERFDAVDQPLLVGPAGRSAAPLIECLMALYATLSSIERAYVGEVLAANEADHPRLLISAAVPTKDAEHAARATATAVRNHLPKLESIVDFAAFDPTSLPDWLMQSGLEPFYVRGDSRQAPSSGVLH